MIHLHLHTMMSLLDSTIRPKELVKKIKELGMQGLAVTEHGNLYSSIIMYKLCKEYGLKYVHGCEVYICNDVNIKDPDNKYNHLILLSKNEVGRLNLIKLVSKSSSYKYYGKPRIDFEMLKEHKDGLIVMSACMAGEISRALMNDDFEKAESIAQKYKSEFGEDYYLEFQSHRDETQQSLNRQIIDLANKLNIKYTVTTDAHYLTKDKQKYHNLFVQIGTQREAGETYNDCYIQTEDEILEICKSTTRDENLKAIKTTHEILDKCNVEIPLSDPIIPHVKIPEGFNNEFEYLKKLCEDGYKNRNINLKDSETQKEYRDRLDYELNAIEKMGFEGYFLLVDSYCNVTTRRGIARGSAGGSLVAYLTHIVDIDPIKHGLYFERFIDVGALELLESGKITKSQLKIPDVDSDFGSEDRKKVIKFIEETYGHDKFINIGSFQYIWAKGAIKDIGKVLNIPFEVTNKITKNLDNETIEEALDLGLLDEYSEEYPELFECASELSGLPKSFSMHPCGKVICMREADYYTSTELNDEGQLVIQADMNDVDDLGLVKIDALGLTTVDIIYDCLDNIGKDYEYIAPHNMDFEDEKVWEQFRKGNTGNIFQFESNGMKNTLRKMQCSSIDELSAANALFRPGSMDYIDIYVKRKNGEEEIEYLHQDLKPILEVTYGVIVFQEQVIEIGKLAGLSNPDELRKATAKKKKKLLDKVKPELFKGLSERGWTQEQLEELWEVLLKFAKYSFNKSHAAAYAIIAYICMYLKVYHSEQFMADCLNNYIGKIKKITPTINEIKRMDIKLQLPKLGCCYGKSKVIESGISIGTACIKNLNYSVGECLRNIKYVSLEDYIITAINKDNCSYKQIEQLIKLGYFDSIYDINYVLESKKYLELFKYGEAKQFEKSKFDEYDFPIGIIDRNSRKTPKQYRDLKCDKILNEIFEWLDTQDISKINSIDKMKYQIDYLGTIIQGTGLKEDRFKLYVNSKRPLLYKNGRKKGEAWAYSVNIMSLASGKDINVTIKNPYFYKHSLEVGDIIETFAKNLGKDDRGYWHLKFYEKLVDFDG